MYKTELYIMMHKLEMSLDDLVNDRSLNRIFHAMHDSGSFNEESVTLLISMLFTHYSKTLPLENFTGASAQSMLTNFTQGLPDSRKECLSRIFKQ